MTATIMADKMNRSVHMVNKYIDQCEALADQPIEFEPIHAKRVVQADPAKPVEPVQESKPDNPLYARNVTENGVVRSTIGTQAASMAADESRKNRKEPENNVSPRMKSHIHVIKKR